MDDKQLGFGFMRLPITDSGDQASIDYETLNRMVDTFLERGFTYFDTAWMYHDFSSEIALRETLVKRHPRESFTVATKMPTMFLESAEDQERIFNEQMEKCGVGYFDYYLIHNLNTQFYPIAEKFDTFGFVEKKKQEGKIGKIGFSFHDNAALLDAILTSHPETDFVQLQINYMDWDNESIQSRKCWEVARKHNKPIVIMEPVKGGTLANIPEEAEKLLKEYNPNRSPASWAVRYAAGLDGVMMVLSGMTNYDQLEDNTEYMREFSPLNDDERDILEKAVQIINDSVTVPCTVCRYCENECPENIAIPDYFALYNNVKQSIPQQFAIQQVYYINMMKHRGKASDCIECGACESHCPQHIEIIRHLKDVAETFEKGGFMAEAPAE